MYARRLHHRSEHTLAWFTVAVWSTIPYHTIPYHTVPTIPSHMVGSAREVVKRSQERNTPAASLEMFTFGLLRTRACCNVGAMFYTRYITSTLPFWWRCRSFRPLYLSRRTRCAWFAVFCARCSGRMRSWSGTEAGACSPSWTLLRCRWHPTGSGLWAEGCSTVIIPPRAVWMYVVVCDLWYGILRTRVGVRLSFRFNAAVLSPPKPTVVQLRSVQSNQLVRTWCTTLEDTRMRLTE